MRAAQYPSFGNPADVLAIADATLPSPARREVRIRTVLASIHNHDLLTVRGLYGYKPTLPAIGGSVKHWAWSMHSAKDVDGLQIGSGWPPPRAWHLGRSVHCTGTHGDSDARGDPRRNGRAADRHAMSALMLLEFLHVEAGQWIVQNTANGAVGKSLAMLARARGVHVANLVRIADAVAQLQALGIDHVFDTSVEGWKDRVREDDRRSTGRGRGGFHRRRRQR